MIDVWEKTKLNLNGLTNFISTVIGPNLTTCHVKLILVTPLVVLLLRDKIVRFLIKASNLAWLLTSIRQTFPDMEPRQIFAQNHGTRMSKIWHTRLLHGNEADAKYRIFWPSGTTMPSALLF